MRLTPPRSEHAHSQAGADLAAALLSLDEETIKVMARRWGLYIPLDEHTFWLVVHKARTGLPSLPDHERQRSRCWLAQNGYYPIG